MMIGQTVAPLRQSPKMPVGDVLSDRRFSALTNVLVFTPYAVYLARGKRPPAWLIAASLAYLAVSFFEDMRFLVQGEQAIEMELGQSPGYPPRPPWRTPEVRQPISQTMAYRYRVNR